MHNIKNIRKNPKNFLEQIKLRNINLNIDNLLLLDKKNLRTPRDSHRLRNSRAPSMR